MKIYDAIKNDIKEGDGIIVIYIILFIILIVVSVFLIFGDTHLTNDGLVIGFFGILATFIVIGNYSQVSKIENKMNKAIEEMNDETDKRSLKYKVNFLYDDLDKPKYEALIDTQKKTIKAEVAQTLKELYNDNEKNLRKILEILITSPHRELLCSLLSGKEVDCSVKTTPAARKVQQAKAKIEGDEIVFRGEDRESISPISIVNGKEYNASEIKVLVLWFHKKNEIDLTPDTKQMLYGARERTM